MTNEYLVPDLVAAAGEFIRSREWPKASGSGRTLVLTDD
jgi:hypothetical protein